MIAYAIQVAMACIFGPVLPIFFWLIRSRTSLRTTLLRESLLTLRKSAFKINAFYSNTLLIAAIIRFNQVPAILEISFMTKLITLQIYIFMVMFTSQLYDFYLNKTKISIPWLVVHAAVCIAQVILALTVSMPKWTFPLCYDAAVACHDLRHTTDISSMFKNGDIHKSSLMWLGVGIAIGLGVGLMLGLLESYVPVFTKFIAKVTAKLPKLVRENGWNVFWIMMLLIWIVVLVLGTTTLFDSRDTMKTLSADQFKDNEWGYGQSTAILLWAQFLFEMVLGVFRKYRIHKL
jgi:hypothetical protein